MKKNSLLWASIFIVSTCVFVLQACSKKSDPAPIPATESVTALLTKGTWKISNVKVDGVDQTALFTGLTLTFSPSRYTSKNGGPIWPNDNSWSFTDDSATAFVRVDGLVVNIVSISESSLVLQMAWNKQTLGGGRANSVKGNHTFTFSK
ncbi:MAG: hypothetical protein K2U26_10965 [Cyclobacteriaceae bacterium]|nr:hypothetical protein [Cyclobacteriaceae bacterium]